MIFLKSELQYSNPFWNAKTKNGRESIDFAHFDAKMIAMVNSLERSENKGQITNLNLRSNTYHTVKTW